MNEMKMPIDMYEFLADEEKKRLDDLTAKVKVFEDEDIEKRLRDCARMHTSLEEMEDKGPYEIFYGFDLSDEVIPLMLKYGADRVNDSVLKIAGEIADMRKQEAGVGNE